jgi:acyl carrier protein
MTREQIALRLREIVRERLAVDAELGPETSLLGDLQLDSLKQLELVVEVENAFGICFEPEHEQEIATVGALVAMIERRLAEGTPGAAEALARG